MRNRPKGRKIGSTSGEQMKAAVLEVVEQKKSVRSVASTYGIVHMTLQRYVNKYKSAADQLNFRFTPNYEVNQVFPRELEEMLCNYLIIACKMHHGLTRKAALDLAYQLAVKNKLKIPKSWDLNKQAGLDWLYGYLQRFPELSIRKPEATSLGRATSFNQTTVTEFFDNLTIAYQQFPDGPIPGDIYNLDETALTTVHNPPKVIGKKGQKQIGQVTSGERGVLVTACCFINAIGNSVPPFLVFPRIHFKSHMLSGAPEGSGGSATKSGWVNGGVFIEILKHFQFHAKSSLDHKVLLILDNHESHITIDSLDFCKENGIILLTLPPHTSGKLQPLDKTVYKSLKLHFNNACDDWMLTHPGQTISIYNIAELLGRAYPKAFTPSNISSGFRSTGIWPLNRDIYGPDDFLSSFVTDRSDPDQASESIVSSPSQASEAPSTSKSDFVHSLPSTSSYFPVTPTKFCSSTAKTPLQPSSDIVKVVSPQGIRPFPKAPPRKSKGTKRRRGKSQILTDTPVKRKVTEELMNRKKPTNSKKTPMPKARVNLSKCLGVSSTDEEEDSPTYDESDDSFSFDDLQTNETPDADLDPSDIKNGDFVLIEEGQLKGNKIYSIGEVLNQHDDDIEVSYVKRLFPSFKFSRTNEIYSFEKEKIVSKLPFPHPSGGTSRNVKVLIFPVDLAIYPGLK